MKDQNNCNHSKTAWKDSKKPVLTGEGLMNYSALRCQKCGAVLEEKFTPINKKVKKQVLGLRNQSTN